MPRHPLTSSTAACCWIPLFALRCEEGRRPELASQPAALLAPDIARRLWQVSPLGRHAGVKPGMTVSQAIGLCPSLRLCEPDPVYYDEQFARLLAALSAVSPVVEPAELGRAYVGTDGLEGLYGAPEGIVEEMQLRIVDCGLEIPASNPQSEIRNPQSGSGGAAANSSPGSPRLVPSRAARSSSARGRRGSFFLPSRSPCCRSIPTRIAGSASSVSRPSAGSRRCRRKRSSRSSAPPAGACGGSGGGDGRARRRPGGTRADHRRDHVLLSDRRARAARACAEPAAR